MAPQILDFQCAIVTGGAGGLGFAMSEYFVSLGKKVIIVGRTESKLKEASPKLKNCPYYTLDTGDVEGIKAKLDIILKEHPEVDALINNAGVQRPLDVDSMDLEKADNEININIRGPLHLATHILPHLKTKKAAVIFNVSSVLGIMPSSIINPVYNGTKAWVHSWTTNQRTVLSKTATHIKVVEIIPPSVGTDLHRERENPDDNKKHKGATSSLTVEEFMEEFIKGCEGNQDEISAGPGVALAQKWADTFGKQYQEVAAKFEHKKL
jgi:short-subunit dehydrogenase involved in D-alanine esterification of teichoic acids